MSLNEQCTILSLDAREAKDVEFNGLDVNLFQAFGLKQSSKLWKRNPKNQKGQKQNRKICFVDVSQVGLGPSVRPRLVKFYVSIGSDWAPTPWGPISSYDAYLKRAVFTKKWPNWAP